MPGYGESLGGVCRRTTLIAVGALAALAFATHPAGARADASWVDLARGRVGDVLWSVKVARPSHEAGTGGGGARRPCLRVGTKWERGKFEYQRSRYERCLNQATRLSAAEPPLVVTGAQTSTGMRVKLTAVGVVASPRARRIKVTYDDGRHATIPLRRASPLQERKSGLASFSYAAFAIPGTWSVERFISEDAAGTTLWDSAESSQQPEAER